MQENEYYGYLNQITDGEATERKISTIIQHTKPGTNPPQVKAYQKKFLNTVRENNRIIREKFQTRINKVLTFND